MAVIFRVTVIKKFGRLASGMWVELYYQNSEAIPMVKDIMDALNNKYGAGTVTGSISKSDLRIEKL